LSALVYEGIDQCRNTSGVAAMDWKWHFI
jgi:hypothetical protein